MFRRSRRLHALFLAAVGLALLAPGPQVSAKGDQQWAEGIPYVTDYDEAIAMAKESGRMLLIYNGWEKPNI